MSRYGSMVPHYLDSPSSTTAISIAAINHLPTVSDFVRESRASPPNPDILQLVKLPIPFASAAVTASFTSTNLTSQCYITDSPCAQPVNLALPFSSGGPGRCSESKGSTGCSNASYRRRRIVPREFKRSETLMAAQQRGSNISSTSGAFSNTPVSYDRAKQLANPGTLTDSTGCGTCT